MIGALFLDTPAELSKRVDRMILHFRHAEFIFLNTRKSGLPTPADLIWILLQDAMHTVRNTPFTELKRVSAVRSLMPATRITDADAFATQLARLGSGMAAFDEKIVRSLIGEADLDRMSDVLDLMRFVTGENAQRRRNVVLARASGLTVEECARTWDKRRVYEGPRQMAYVVQDAKHRVMAQIFEGLQECFGLVRTSRGFRRVTVRAIEQRTRARKRDEARARAEAKERADAY